MTPLEDVGELHPNTFLRRDGGRVLFVWNRTAAQRVRLTPADASGTLTEYALDGSRAGAPLTSPYEIVLARGEPRIFRWRRRRDLRRAATARGARVSV